MVYSHNSSGAGAERELIVQSSRLRLTMYVCMYVCMCAVTPQECNYVFYACAHRHHGHALAGLAAPPPDKTRVKFEAQRLAKLREGERTLEVGGGETEDDAERK